MSRPSQRRGRGCQWTIVLGPTPTSSLRTGVTFSDECRGAQEPLEARDALAHAVGLREAVRNPLAETADAVGAAGCLGDARHPHAVEPAGHDPLERLQVVVD